MTESTDNQDHVGTLQDLVDIRMPGLFARHSRCFTRVRFHSLVVSSCLARHKYWSMTPYIAIG